VRATARTLGLEDQLKKKPRALSGGQRQRVAMGRAIVREPQAFLMDEPLSNLDAKLRVQMRTEISRIQRDLGVTTIYVTHDQTEAVTMGDLVAVMKRGELQQVDAPQALYDTPANLFVAGFIGSPAMNMVGATLAAADGAHWVCFGSQRLRLAEELVAATRTLRDYEGRDVVLGIRPEDIEDPRFVSNPLPEARLSISVDLREAMGSEVYAHFTVDAPPVLTEDTRELAADADEAALQDLNARASGSETRFVARLSPRTDARPGHPLELHVDTRALHFFDPETGAAIQ
jgi:multiple sugar transport system ATP-binding protein